MGINHHYDAMQAVAPIVDLVRKPLHSNRLPQVLVATGSYKVFAIEHFAEGITELIEAKTLARQVNDQLAYWYSVFFLGSIYWLEAAFETSSDHFRLSLEQSRKTGSVSGQCFSLCSMAAWPMGYDGRLAQGLEMSRTALTLAVERGDLFVQQCAYSSRGCCLYLYGQLEQAREHLLKGNELYEKAGNIFWGALGQFWLGELHQFIGEYGQAIRFYQQSARTIREQQVLPSWPLISEVKIAQCQCHLAEGSTDYSRMYRIFEDNRIEVNKGIMANSIADILLHQDDEQLNACEKWINSAISLNTRHNNFWRLASDYHLAARLARRRDRHEQSLQLLTAARQIYLTMGADAWARRLQEKLSS